MRNLLLSLLLAVPFTVEAAPMTNDDVIKMVKGGLGEATVIQAIDTAEAGFDTSPDGLVKLKQGGVSDAVIQRIMGRKNTTTSACANCGTVTGIREIEKPRKVGTGTAAGAVIGGVLGYAIGGHNNRGVGTVVGATGGAVAGNVIENKAGENRTFEIGVHFDDGSSRIFTQETHPSLRQGSRVRVVNGVLGPL